MTSPVSNVAQTQRYNDTFTYTTFKRLFSFLQYTYVLFVLQALTDSRRVGPTHTDAGFLPPFPQSQFFTSQIKSRRWVIDTPEPVQ